MKDTGSHPGEPKILALVDGELAPEEASEVREHCETCESCRRVRDEIASVMETLRAQPAGDPVRPVWPAVKDRLERERRSVLRPVFGATAAAAVAAGVLLGVLLGSAGRRPATEEASYLWSVVGSNLADDGVSDAYARMASGEER